MNKLSRFVFNSFSVNTYVLADESGKCIIIDPACYSADENKKLADFIYAHSIEPVCMINTHFHVDHILGNNFVCDAFNIKPVCHAKSKFFWEMAPEFASVFGFQLESVIVPKQFVEHGDIIPFGNSQLQVLYTPGHADGSICLVNHAERYVVTGDILFRDSIGRTDLPTGNFDVLQTSITEQLFILPDDYVVYPGHGPESSIGYEKINNPFLS